MVFKVVSKTFISWLHSHFFILNDFSPLSRSLEQAKAIRIRHVSGFTLVRRTQGPEEFRVNK